MVNKAATTGPLRPRAQQPRIESTDFDSCLVEEDGVGELSGFSGALDLNRLRNLVHLEIVDCELVGLDGLTGERVETIIEIRDSTATGLDLSQWTISSIARSRIERSKFVGTVVEASISDSTFIECKFDSCLIRFATLSRVEFTECQLSDVDFHRSKLTNVRISGADFSGVGFDRCTIESVDLRGTNLSGVGDPRSFVGATIDSVQVHQIAEALAVRTGIVVLDGR